MSAGEDVPDKESVGCDETQQFFEILSERSHSPTRVRKSNMTTGGAMRGKMSAKVEAKMMASTQAPTAYDGL
jgi:hypothetical protein